MGEYRDVLERAAANVEPPGDPWERLSRRRDRRRRMDRLLAGAIAIAVAAAGTTGAFLALHRGPGSRSSAVHPSPQGAARAYFVRLPAQLGPPGVRGLATIEAVTNLPDGTKVGLYFFSKDEENPAGPALVEHGHILTMVANNYCHLIEGRLIGSEWQVTITVAPVLPYPVFGPPRGPGTASPTPNPYGQPASVLAVLGQHFEHVGGDQVRRVGQDNQMVVTRTYRLPADTCTDRIVYLPGGNLKQVPVRPRR